jgi:hypothetical protein
MTGVEPTTPRRNSSEHFLAQHITMLKVSPPLLTHRSHRTGANDGGEGEERFGGVRISSKSKEPPDHMTERPLKFEIDATTCDDDRTQAIQ